MSTYTFFRPDAVSSPEVDEKDQIISRLIKKVADLEEKLYMKEFEEPTVPSGKVDPLPEASSGDVTKEGRRKGDRPKATDWLSSFNFKEKEAQRQVQAAVKVEDVSKRDVKQAESRTTDEDLKQEDQKREDQRVDETAVALHQQPSESPRHAGPSDWFTNLWRKPSRGGQAPENERSLEVGVPPRLEAPTSEHSDRYLRYVFDPVDVEAEMEVTAKVRKAAAEALMEAQAKLAAAEEQQRVLQDQIEASRGLTLEVERLQQENQATLEMKRQLEQQMLDMRASIQDMNSQHESLQQELEGMREQSDIWKSNQSSEQEKLKAENEMVRRQLQKRLNDMQALTSKHNEAEAEIARLTKEKVDTAGQLAFLKDVQSKLESAMAEVELHKKAAADWQDKFMKERNVRRKLHEQLQVLKGNIRVMCRVRPVLPGQKSIMAYPLEGLLTIAPPDKRAQEFEFDHVFGPDADQESIYESVSPLVRSCADGFNVCIFAYGQTGSGKTYTMDGPPDCPGINVRALQELFQYAEEEGMEQGCEIWVSMMEIYNEQVHDLLSPSDCTRALEVSALGPGDLPTGMDRVPGVTWCRVSTLDDVRARLREGSKNRTTASTAMNASSSRSHALLSVKATFAHPDGRTYTSQIHLVDLAGSERIDKSEVVGQQLKEAQSINKSLSALGDVISALQRKNAHIPFRNSKLTQVLCDSLSGSSKVLLVCNLSPEPSSASETMSSLNFATRAGQVELGQTKRASDRPASSSTPDRTPPAISPSNSNSRLKDLNNPLRRSMPGLPRPS